MERVGLVGMELDLEDCDTMAFFFCQTEVNTMAYMYVYMLQKKRGNKVTSGLLLTPSG